MPISGLLIKKAGFKRTEAQAGGVTFVQRFGSALNLNIHLHCLVLDGVYHRRGEQVEFRRKKQKAKRGQKRGQARLK